MPPIEKLALPGEQAELAELLHLLGSANGHDPKAVLPILDGILAKLPQPTMLRGFVQMTRASVFEALDRHAEATAAIEEAIRLLPGYAGPLMTAAAIYLYSNNPGLASDAIVRASEIDPEGVRQLPDYHTSALLRRLDAIRDEKRARMLSDRLLAIGWTGSGVKSRSELAAMAIRKAVTDQDVARARSLVPDLLDPEATYGLLADAKFKEIWPDIEKWAGPRLSVQWTMYLDEARKRWLASGDLERGADYAAALRTAGHFDTLIAEFLPLYQKSLDGERDWPLLFIAAKVVSALMAGGRTGDALDLYRNAAKIWPIGSSANALNLYANEATALLYADRPADALAKIDAAIQDSHRYPGEINVDAVAGMHLTRACALHELGRDAEATVSAIVAAQAGHARGHAEVALCMGKPAEAKAALLKAFAQLEERSSVIGFMQPEHSPVIPTSYGRRRRADEDALRHDPELLSAVAQYGRILPFTLSDGAPNPAQ
jgi:tetratricopeptide (TPR) repeat protein